MLPRGWVVVGVIIATAAAAVAIGGAVAPREGGAAFLRTIGEKGFSRGRFHRPRGLATDGRSVYVVDCTGRIAKFTADGRHVRTWHIPQKKWGFPEGLAIDRDGSLLVADTHCARVLRYSPEGALLRQRGFGKEGEAPGEMIYPLGVAVNARGEIYVCEYGGSDHRVLRFDENGRFLRQVGTLGSGRSEFRRPSGIAVDREGFVYVADAANHRIQKLSAELEYVAEWGALGGGPGEFSYPYDVAVGPWPGEGKSEDGRQAVYVVEYGNHRVQIFSTAGEWLTSFGGFGSEEGLLTCPWCLAVTDEGIVYVADTYNHRVQAFRVRAVSSVPAGGAPEHPGD